MFFLSLLSFSFRCYLDYKSGLFVCLLGGLSFLLFSGALNFFTLSLMFLSSPFHGTLCLLWVWPPIWLSLDSMGFSFFLIFLLLAGVNIFSLPSLRFYGNSIKYIFWVCFLNILLITIRTPWKPCFPCIIFISPVTGSLCR